MAAYIMVGIDVLDPEGYTAYTREVPGTLAPYGGRFIVRGGAFEVMEGTFEASRVVVLEFPDLAAARAWYGSEAYQAILPIREANARAHFLVAVEGVPPEGA